MVGIVIKKAKYHFNGQRQIIEIILNSDSQILTILDIGEGKSLLYLFLS